MRFFKKNPKFRLGQDAYDDPKVVKEGYTGRRVLKFFWYGLVILPVKLGERLIRIVIYPFKVVASDLDLLYASWPVRKYRLKNGSVVFTAMYISISSVLFVGFLYINSTAGQAWQLKGRVLGEARIAAQYAAQAGAAFEQQDLEKAASSLSKISFNFNEVLAELEHSSAGLTFVSTVVPQGRDGVKLLEAAKGLGEAAARLTRVLAKVGEINFGENGLIGQPAISPEDLNTELTKISIEIDSSLKLIQEINPQILPDEYKSRVAEAQALSREVQELMPALTSMMQLGTAVLSGQYKVLVFLQNSNELRPTGGFVGTYGWFVLDKGYIQSRTISSIYDLDGQLKNVYKPPLPILAVNQRWYLRDSNWFFDFPASASVMSGLFQEITGQKPDIVLTLTPQTVEKLLQLTGDITLADTGVVLNSENFVERTQVETSVFYDREENKPKKMIADFFPIFLDRLSKLPAKQKTEVWKIMLASLASKDIQIFAQDQGLATSLQQLGWDGRVKQAERDYLAVVSSNLGGTKTDLGLQQAVKLVSTVARDGQVDNELFYTRSNPLPDVAGLENLSFIRFYVPEGARLVSAQGFDQVELGSIKENSEQLNHPAVEGWESGAVRTLAGDVLVGVESGRTYFGGWIRLRGGESKNIVLKYTLPVRLGALDRWSMVMDKQAGAQPFDLEYAILAADRRVLWTTEDMSFEQGRIASKFLIDRPVFVGLVLGSE